MFNCERGTYPYHVLRTWIVSAGFNNLVPGTHHNGAMVNVAPIESARVLKAGGFLVMFETNEWFESTTEMFSDHGLVVFHRLRLAPGVWWTDYYAPLEARITRLRAIRTDTQNREVLRGLEHEVAEVKADVAKTDCSFVVVRRQA